MKPRARQLGVTDDLYFTLLGLQEGRCAIRGCNRTPKTRRFHVDHDHDTGRVRGLLCHWHNRILPKTPAEARAMADYLEGELNIAAVEREILPTVAQMHREAAKVTPRR